MVLIKLSTILPLLLVKVVEVFYLLRMKIKIDKIVINDVLYDVVDGGISCKDCAIRNLCMINGFADGVTIDCTSVHLVSKGAYKE